MVGLFSLVQFVFIRPPWEPSAGQAATTTVASGQPKTAKPITGASVKWVTATDRSSRVAVPKSWSRMELNSDADIELGSDALHQYLIVVTDDKADLATNLSRFAQDTIGALTRDLRAKQISTPRHLQVGGRPALLHEIHGVVDHTRVVYWHTSVEGVHHYYQVLAWTTTSHAADNGPKLRGVIATFREIAK